MPSLAVQQASADPTGDAWHINWRITNTGRDPIALHSAWLPHGRFRSQEWQLDPPLHIPAGGEATLESRVKWQEEPGTVVENGFLILRLDGWRVFARLTIIRLPDGSPQAICEGVTLQPAR